MSVFSNPPGSRTVVELPVRRCDDLGGGYTVLVLDDSSAGWRVRPGNFFMLSVPGFFLRRPFCMAFRDEEGLGFLIRTVGRGSRKLACCRVGDSVSVLGPCGNDFGELCEGDVLVAGGIGLAPLLALWSTSADRPPAARPPFLIGMKGDGESGLADFVRQRAEVEIVFEQGASSSSMTVIDLLKDYCGSEKSPDIRRLIACGPPAFIEALVDFARRKKVKCLVSLEARMGCGFGVCLGCAVVTGNDDYLLLCRDGPVVDADSLRLSRST